MVTDQKKALQFYTEVLGFMVKTDMPMGEHSWLTVVSKEDQAGPELLLEPMAFEPARVFQQALYAAGIPLTSFFVDDIEKEFSRLEALGVRFSMQPTQMGPATIAVFDDTCGNWIQMAQV